MEWRTELHITEKRTFLTHTEKVFSVGSCFAEAIGKRLAENKWDIAVNPFGTIYNPISIFRLIRFCSQLESPQEKFCLKNTENIWLHYDFHSVLRADSKEELWQVIAEKILQMRQFFQQSSVLLLTLGTAFVYEVQGHIVANCHKMPASTFQSRLLTVEDILKDFEKTSPAMQEKKIILTVSPVRHLRNNLPLNSVSKAILRLACHYLQEKYSNIFYFPAFEIVIDDLRDYRFYAEDLLHITTQAENYIWQKFVEKFMPIQTQQLIEKWQKILQKLKHKPFNPQSDAHQKFLQSTLQELRSFSSFFDVHQEETLLQSQLMLFLDKQEG